MPPTPAPLASMSVPERYASGELLCACKEKLTTETAKKSKTVRRRVVFILSSAPSRAGVEGCPMRQIGIARLRTSPVSWLGGSSGPFESGPLRGLPAASPSEGATGRSGLRIHLIRLTVARRRRLTTWRFRRGRLEPAIRLPEHEVRGECGLQHEAAGLGLGEEGRTKVRPYIMFQ